MPRKPDMPCATCGQPMWRGKGTRPAGQAICSQCRTEIRNGERETPQHITLRNEPEPKPARTCEIDQCTRKHLARGRCATHYAEAYRQDSPHNYTCIMCKTQYRSHRKSRGTKPTCSRQCTNAYINWQRAGQEPSNSTELAICYKFEQIDELERAAKHANEQEMRKRWRNQRSMLRKAYEDGDHTHFIAEVRRRTKLTPDGCWEWQGRINNGYPERKLGGTWIAVHRAVLEAKHGQPLGSQAAHHKCANSKCVNPDHLQPVTHRENIAEMLARKSYITRIQELEDALRELNPGHPLLNMIPVAANF